MASFQAPDPNGTHLPQEARRIIHAIGKGAGPAAAPIAAAALLPVLGVAVLVAELTLVLIVFGIAVYGTQERVDRIFRLLRWLRSRPEPSPPTSAQENSTRHLPAHQPRNNL
jgi:hypothetical protein